MWYYLFLCHLYSPIGEKKPCTNRLAETKQRTGTCLESVQSKHTAHILQNKILGVSTCAINANE